MGKPTHSPADRQLDQLQLAAAMNNSVMSISGQVPVHIFFSFLLERTNSSEKNARFFNKCMFNFI